MTDIALVTGASAGFGIAIVERLIADGYKVVGAARRFEKLQELAKRLGEDFYPLEMDVTDRSSVDKALASLPTSFEPISLLVNNAGLALGLDKAYEADFEDWLTMIETNVIGLAYVTRKLLPDMVKRNHGLIVNLGSTAGTVPYLVPMSMAAPRLLSSSFRSICGLTLLGHVSVCPISSLGFVRGQSFPMSVLRVMMSVLKSSTRERTLFKQKTSQRLSLG